MPMIDIYATAGTFQNVHQLAMDAAAVVKSVEGVPDIALFRKNTAAFVHELPKGALSNVDGDSNYVRIHVTTNIGALAQREKQIALVQQLTELAARAAGDSTLPDRTWVILVEAIAGGWGLKGHAHTNDELVSAARAELAKLKA
jgi:phenylpyruvate tautomerase PptA (4-oxalocrotonate tautomerase family)